MSAPVVRPMVEADLAAFAEVTATSYHDVDVRTSPSTWPAPVRRPAARNELWIRRTAHALSTDPGGCWVAEVDGAIVGGAVSRVRELMWILSSFAVAPGAGIGTALLRAAMHHGRGCLRGMFASSADPAAVRTYRRAGFSLHPQMLLRGDVDRDAIPQSDRVRGGGPGDRDLMDSVDRQARGAAHGPDHEVLLAQHPLVVRDHRTGSGYAYLDPSSGAPVLLAATNRRTAVALMWEALASSAPGAVVVVPHVTTANEWAVDVGLDARLDVHQSGYLALRHMAPPSPYLHHGSLL